MITRYFEEERAYRRRMALSYPLSLAVLAGLFLTLPGEDMPLPREFPVGMKGPLNILPQVDILPDEIEERRLTAAPHPSAPSAFEVVDLDFVETPTAEPLPEPVSSAEVIEIEPLEEPEVPDFQDAVRTTGHPILGETEYELIHFERPVYPLEAVVRGIEGLVEVMILVDAGGSVSQSHVLHPNRIPILERAASDAVVKSRFKAHVVNGEPTPFWVKVPFEFRLVNPH